MDRIALLNGVIEIVKPEPLQRPVVESMDQNLIDLGLDSLDTFLITVYLCDVYGTPEEKLRELRPTVVQVSEGSTRRVLTAAQVFDFIEQHKTKDPASIEEALGSIK